MDPLRAILQEYPVAGLEINERSLRFALLTLTAPERTVKKKRPPKTKKPAAGAPKGKTALEHNILTAPAIIAKPSIQITALAEETLPEGTIVEGLVKKPNLLTAALIRLKKKSKSGSPYVIASIPPNIVYTRLFAFPASITGKRLEETMQLTAGFQLPLRPEQTYLDWEETQSKKKESAVLLALAARSAIDPYLRALDQAGFRTVALEHHLLSIGRALPKDDGVTLLSVTESSSVTVAALASGELRFMRSIPLTVLDATQREQERERIDDFVETTVGAVTRRLTIPDGIPLPDILTQNSRTQEQPAQWLVSVGAGLRGLLPRGADTLISLLPVGTEEAFERQKALAFAGLLANLTIGVATVIAAGFITVWPLLSYLQEQVINQPSLTVSLTQDARGALSRADRLNALLATAAPLAAATPRFSVLLTAINETIPSGVRVTEVNAASLDSGVRIAGNAVDRTALTTFRDKLEASTLFSGVTLPITDLGQRENIPFTMTMMLENSSALLGFSQ